MNESPFAELEVVRFLEHTISALNLDLTFEIKWREESVPDLAITFSGPDVALLAEENGDLLRAIEHLAARVGGLELERRSPPSKLAGVPGQAHGSAVTQNGTLPPALHVSPGVPIPFQERRRQFKPSRSSMVKFNLESAPDSTLSYAPDSTIGTDTVTTLACDYR
jgi:hypothetical protein